MADMNERLIINLKLDGAPLALDSLDADGVRINSETDAWPRGLTLEFSHNNPITEAHMHNVRSMYGWDSGTYKLKLTLDSGALVVTGVEKKALPPGSYWFKLRIADLILPTKRTVVQLKEGGATSVDVAVRADARQVEVSLDPAKADQDILRLLGASKSMLDGQGAANWLLSPAPRSSRKACLLNLLAKLRAAPNEGEALLTQVEHVFFADVDRCYFAVKPDLLTRLETLAAGSNKHFDDDGAPAAPVHKRLMERVKILEGGNNGYRLRSFRQKGKLSLQAVVAAPFSGDTSRQRYAEFDIDLGNPGDGLKGFFVHLGELLSPGKTNHIKLREKLAKDQRVGKYLCYQVISDDDG